MSIARVLLIVLLLAAVSFAEEAETPLHREAVALFEELEQAIEQQRTADIAERIDTRTLIETALSYGLSERPAVLNDAGFYTVLANEFAEGMQSGGMRPMLVDSRVLRADVAERPDRAIVLTRYRVLGADGHTRWWLRRDGQRWRIYDWEDIDAGIRGSMSVALSLQGLVQQGGPVPWVDGLKQVLVGVQHLLQEEPDQALAVLEAADLGTAPAPFHVHRLAMLTGALLHLEDYERALATLEQAEALGVDMPLLTFQRGSVMHGLGRYDEALAAYETYRQRIGDTSTTWLMIAYVHDDAGRPEQAFEAYSRCLDLAPDEVDALQSWAAMLDDDRADAVPARFAALGDPFEYTTLLGEVLLSHDHLLALEKMLDACRRVDPDHPEVHYYHGMLVHRRGDLDAALESLRFGIVRAPDDEKPYFQYMIDRIMAETDRAEQAYRESPTPGDTFETLAEWLDAEGKGQALVRLAERRLADAPDDVNGWYYQGLGMAATERWQGAAEAYRQAAQRAGDDMDLRDESYDRWSEAVAMCDDWATVYEPMRQDAKAFDYLARTFGYWDMNDQLSALLDMHAGRGPTIWRAQWLLNTDRPAEAAAYFDQHDELFEQREAFAWSYVTFRFFALFRTGRFDEAMNYAQRSTAMDDDPYYELLVHIARGDATEAVRAAQVCVDYFGYDPRGFYDDPDIAANLTSDVMAPFREAYPVPELTPQPAN